MDEADEPALPSQAVLARDRIFRLRLQIEKAAREHPRDVPALKTRLSHEMKRLHRLSKADFNAHSR